MIWLSFRKDDFSVKYLVLPVNFYSWLFLIHHHLGSGGEISAGQHLTNNQGIQRFSQRTFYTPINDWALWLQVLNRYTLELGERRSPRSRWTRRSASLVWIIWFRLSILLNLQRNWDRLVFYSRLASERQRRKIETETPEELKTDILSLGQRSYGGLPRFPQPKLICLE